MEKTNIHPEKVWRIPTAISG